MEATTIAAEMFPVTVRTPDGSVYGGAKVLVTADYLWLFVRQGPVPRFVRGVTLTGLDPVGPGVGSRSAWNAVDDAGGAWQVTPGTGCCCGGNPLCRFTADGLLALVP